MEGINLGLLIYFYSIWDNIRYGLNNLMGIIFIFTLVGGVILTMVYNMAFDIDSYYSEQKNERHKQGRTTILNFSKTYLKIVIPIVVISWFVVVFTPKKEYLPLIFFSDDVANVVVESLESGKLQKINEIFELKIEETLKNLKGEK